MKTANGFTTSQRQKEFRILVRKALKTINNTIIQYDMSKAAVDWAEHRKLRDLLAVRAAERQIGKKLIERHKCDRIFVSDKENLAEEFEAALLTFPYALLGPINLLGSNEYNPIVHFENKPLDEFEISQEISGQGSNLAVDEFFKKIGLTG